MANYKRGRPKNARSGCLLCKPHKGNGADRRTIQERREDQYDPEDEEDFREGAGPVIGPPASKAGCASA